MTIFSYQFRPAITRQKWPKGGPLCLESVPDLLYCYVPLLVTGFFGAKILGGLLETTPPRVWLVFCGDVFFPFLESHLQGVW